MKNPWVGRAELQAAENLRLAAQQMLAQSEVARVKAEDAARDKYDALKELLLITRGELDRSEAERKLLLDRIVQLSGQPAIYQKRDTAEARDQRTEKNEAAEKPPIAERRVGFDDVHKAARQAIKDGTYALKGRVN